MSVVATGIELFFADPQSQWQRGSRRTPIAYCGSFPKGVSDLAALFLDRLAQVQEELKG